MPASSPGSGPPAPTPARAGRSSPSIERGGLIDRYVVLGLVGEGGMGIVYRAFDPELQRLVAIKLLRPAHVAREGESQARERLVAEARSQARLSHPNVIHVYDVGPHAGDVFVAMEFVEGVTLGRWLAAASRSRAEIVAAFLSAGEGLAAAHAADVVHRDFKPENVIVADDGRVLVLDFGLARAGPRSVTRSDPPPGSQPAAELTASGATRPDGRAGTPRYMAPEQHLGEDVDARSDQFSFAVALYEALYRRHPFGMDDSSAGAGTQADTAPLGSLASIERSITGQVAAPPPGSDVPAWVRRALLRALAPEPALRFPSMRALLAALRADPWIAARRWLAASGVVAVVAAAVSAAAWSAHRQSLVCQGAEQRIAGVWGPGRAEAIRGAFAATHVPYAADAVRAVTADLDAYAAAWSAMRTEACEATRVRGEQSEELLDLRMECLEQRRTDLASQVDVLAAADAQVVSRAAQATRGMPRIEDCANTQALRAPTRLPADPATRAKVEALRQRLSRADALWKAGVYGEGMALARAVVDESGPLGYPPLKAEALLALGNVQESVGDYAGARRTFDDAVIAAEAGRHDEVAARGWTAQVWVLGERLGRYDDAREAGRHAAALVERLNDHALLEADLLHDLGAVAAGEGKFDEVTEKETRALALRESALGPDDPKIAESVACLADNARDLAHYDQAIAGYHRAAAIWEKALGPGHPKVGVPLNNLGIVYERIGRYDEALDFNERAVALWERSLGPDHPHVAEALTNAGVDYQMKRDYPRAIACYERALAIDEKGDDPRGPAFDFMNLSEATLGEGRAEGALAYAQRALAIVEKTEGPAHHYTAVGLRIEGNALRELGKLDRALADEERAVAVDEKALGASHPDLAEPLVALARVHVARAKPALAVPALERALALRLSQAGDRVLVAQIQWLLAQSLGATDAERARARELAVAARATYAGAGPAFGDEVTKIDGWAAAHR